VVILEVAIDRECVHAGDDLANHATSISFDLSATLRALIMIILKPSGFHGCIT